MKKIILIICMFFITGCYDYIEINNLSFISALGIDYEDEKYKLTVEAISNSSDDKESLTGKGFTVDATGKTLAKAFNNISLDISKIPYYNHLKVVVVSKEVAQNHMQEIFEYLTRNPKIRKEFFLVISEDYSPKEILNSRSDNVPIVGQEIVKIIENNPKEFNASYNLTYQDMLADILNPYVDAKATVITKKDENISIKGIGIFKDYKYLKVLSTKNSAYLNLLINQKSNVTLAKNYKDKNVTIKLGSTKVRYSFKNNKVIINVSADGEIIENMPNFDLLSQKTYTKLNKDFSKILKKELYKFFDSIKKYNTDILGIQDKYYKKTKQAKININDIEIKTSIKVNKKGLIYEAKHE